MAMPKLTTFLVIIGLCLLGGCNIDPTAPGPQPIVLEHTEHIPKLNVFGILRPDSLQGLPLSYVHLEFAYPADEFPDSAVVPDAEVKIIQWTSSTAVDSAALIYTDFDLFPTKEYRSTWFCPQEGSYTLICRRDGYPTLTAETILPPVPILQRGSLQRTDHQLSFIIERDEQVGLYEVVLAGADWQLRDRFVRPKTGDIQVSFSLSGVESDSCTLIIYGFDLNLSEYLTANLSIKPNIYQKDFSTVENGYGCFGALNVYRQAIQF